MAVGRRAQAEDMIRSRLPDHGWLDDVDGPKPEPDEDDVVAVAAAPGAVVGSAAAAAEVAAAAMPGASADSIASAVSRDRSALARFAELGAAPTSASASASVPASSAAVAASSSESSSFAPASRSALRKGMDLPEHKLWALLGDIRKNAAYYQRAWTASGRAFPKAQRALGNMALQRGDHDAAYAHYRLALNINAAVPDIWFAAGSCCMELRRYSDGVECYSRAVSLVPTYGEAWNNLAACHLYLKSKRAAFGALEHATRLKRDSWKIWENYLNCAMDLGEHQKAVAALEQLAALRGSTDAGTLLPVRYSGHQAKMHMIVIAQLTAEAERDALRAFRLNNEELRAAEAEKRAVAPIPHVSFLAQRLVGVLQKLEGFAAELRANEASMGGRKRGGGEAAGAANSVTASVDRDQQARKEALALKREAKAAVRARARALAARRALAKANAIEEGEEGEEGEEEAEEGKSERKDPEDGSAAAAAKGDGEEEDDEEDEDDDAEAEESDGAAGAEHVVGEAGVLSKKLFASLKKRSPVDEALGSLALQYDAFLLDSLARVLAAQQQYQASAARRERQVTVLLDMPVWATKPKLVAEIVSVAHEAVRVYKLAADLESHIRAKTGAAGPKADSLPQSVAEGAGAAEERPMEPQQCLTSARFLAQRALTAVEAALRASLVKSASLQDAANELGALYDAAKAAADAAAPKGSSSGASAAEDRVSDYYRGADDYDMWR